MKNLGASPVITNCLFWENFVFEQSHGGGLDNSNGSSLFLINCTIVGNRAGYGGAMVNSGSDVTIANCIIWGNDAVHGWLGIQDIVTNTILSHSIVQYTSNSGGDGNIRQDPNFGPNFTLKPGSPAINGGDNSMLPTGISTDLYGNDRILLGTVDMGVSETGYTAYNRLYVNAGVSASGEGTSWATAFKTLPEALAIHQAFSNIKTIFVAKGIYYPSSGSDRAASMTIANPVKIYGGFVGTESSISQRDLSNSANATILSGDLGILGNNTDNSYHVIIVAASDVTLDGLTIQDGHANGGGSKDEGGGIYSSGNHFIKVNACKFKNNNAITGGAIRAGGDVADYFTNNLFKNNTADNGSAIASIGGNHFVYNNTFTGNTVSGSGNGGIYYSSNTLSYIRNNIFYNNALNSLPELVHAGGGSQSQNNNLFSADPLFINVSDADYRVRHCSPVINAGDNTVSADIGSYGLNGKPRLWNGSTADIGAYEYQGGSGGSVRYVKINATGNEDGSSWANAYGSIQDAIDAACVNDSIFIAKGTYYPTTSDDRSASIVVHTPVKIFGGFEGTESTFDQRDLSNPANATILNGDIGINDNNMDNSYHVVKVTASDATFDGLNIQNGYADGGGSNSEGGGIYSLGNYYIHVNACRFKNNTASASGGAIRVGGDVADYFTNNLFVNNTAGTGSAIASINGKHFVYNNTFTENTVSGGGNGGTYYSSNTLSTLKNNIFYNNALNSLPELVHAGGGSQDQSDNLIGTDPEFVNASNNFYQLRRTSTAINAGVLSITSDLGNYDLAGKPRNWNDALIDIGAFEYQGDFTNTIRYVNGTASGNNDGTSWENAFTLLQNALSSASPGDTIFIAKGTYYPTTESDRAASFVIPNALKLFGGFTGTEVTLAERDLTNPANATILDGNINGTGNSYHVVTVVASDVTLDKLTIQNGQANGGGSNNEGGGIYSLGNYYIHINACRFKNNTASASGGAIRVGGDVADYFTNNLFVNNRAATGSAIASISGNHFVYNNTFTGNTVSGSGSGGTYYSSNTLSTLKNNIFYNNALNSLPELVHTGGGSQSQSNNLIGTNPEFFNAAVGNYNLKHCSAAINGGDNIVEAYIGTYDVTGDLRNSGIVDIGAIEFQDNPYQTVFYVNANATGNNTGSDWTNAFTTIKEAMKNICEGDSLFVAKGTYRPTTGGNRNITFDIFFPVKLFGGFAGTEATLAERDLSNPENASILSGEIQQDGDQSNNSFTIMHITSIATIDGFTFKKGFSGGGGPGATLIGNVGGAVFNTSNPTIKNCIFKDNSASGIKFSPPFPPIGEGGAWYNASGNPVFINCLFYNNKANAKGGALSVAAGSPEITNCTFYNNTALDTKGGAISYTSGSPQITNSIFYGNTGGDLHKDGSTNATISYSLFADAAFPAGTVDGSSNQLSTDPLFADVSIADFTLQAASPAKDAGNNVANIEIYDLSNLKRIINTTIDMGAYEACSSSTTIDIAACGSYTSPSGKYVWTSTGTYVDTIPNSNGCDSIITVKLTIPSIDNTVTQNGAELTANETGATYQWIDCTKGNAPITGETNQVFVAAEGGNYAVVITKSACSDTSACITVAVTDMEASMLNNNVSIHPNPSTGRFSIDFGKPYSTVDIQLTDITGKTILLKTLTNQSFAEFNIENKPKGIYMIKINADEQRVILRVVNL